MTITTTTIRNAAILRDQSGHGSDGLVSDLEHILVEPGHHYGLGFNGFAVQAIRDVDDDCEGCYLIDICDLGDVEDLRDEAEQAGDSEQYELCVAALDGDMDALGLCVEVIMETQIRSAD